MTAIEWRHFRTADEWILEYQPWVQAGKVGPQPSPPTELLPGMLLRMRDGRVVLVGHINDANGGCGCCGGIETDGVAEFAMLELPVPTEPGRV